MEAPFNNPLLDPNVVRVGGRPDDLPAYPLFKTRQQKIDERIRDSPEHEPYVEVSRPEVVASEVPIYYHRNWSVLNPNPVLTHEIPSLIVLWYWATRFFAQPLAPMRAWNMAKALGYGPITAEGNYRPKWTYPQFWKAYWDLYRRGRVIRSAARMSIAMYWSGLAYMATLYFFSAATRGLSQMDQRIVPGLATIPVLTYFARINGAWRFAHFWLYVFGVNVASFVATSWVMGVPLKLGHRFRGPYTKLFRIEESPDFYLTKPGDATVLEDPHYLRDKHMGYTELY